jgi:hypothetical protein
MMLPTTIRRRDVLNPRYRFRSAVTGLFVTRWFALLHPRETVKERVG